MDVSDDHLVSDVVIESFEFTAPTELECKIAEDNFDTSGRCGYEINSPQSGSEASSSIDFDRETVVSISNCQHSTVESNLNGCSEKPFSSTPTPMLQESRIPIDGGSRLDQVTDRIFAAISPSGDTKLNHLACVAHIRDRIRAVTGHDKVLVFNCQDPDQSINQIFQQVVDCCFDLCGTPDLESMIAFCEVFYDWLALDPRHTVLFHAESAAALQRLLILLYSYACFCDSMERKNMNISRCIKEYISGYPNGSVCPSVAFLRYAEYMSLFSPYRRMGLLRATMSIHCMAIFNLPLFADSCISVFFKFYSYLPLRPIYTTATCKVNGKPNNQLVIQFCEAPIMLRGDVVLVCYRVCERKSVRQRLFRLNFHSCEAYSDVLTFQHDAFDELCEATPGTFKVDLHLSKCPDVNPRRTNCFVEYTQKTLARQNSLRSSTNPLSSLNVIEKGNPSDMELRLADSLEDLVVGSQNAPLPFNRRSHEGLQTLRTENFSQHLAKRKVSFGNYCSGRWNFDASLAKSRLKTAINAAPERPPPPNIPGYSRLPRADGGCSLSLNASTNSRESVDSGASFPSRLSASSSNGPEGLSNNRDTRPDCSSTLMPPPKTNFIPRMLGKSKTTTHQSKTVAFKNPKMAGTAGSARAPLEAMELDNLDSQDQAEKMNTGDAWEGEGEALKRSEFETKFTRLCRLLKTPAGVRGVPTKFFGPPEKTRRTIEYASTTTGRFLQNSERSTPTIPEEDEEEYDTAAHRQLQAQGYQFQEAQVNMSTTQELDQLLDELRMTSMNISSSGRPPAPHPSYGHSSRSSFNNSQLNSTASRYPLRSASSSNYQRGLSTTGSTTGKWSSSYQREAAYSSERQFSTSEGGRPFTFQRSNSYGQATSTLGNSLQPSPPALTPYRQPVSPSKRYQTTYKTTLTHLPPASPKRFGQVHLTIDPESGCASATSVGDVHYLSTGTANQYHTNSTSAMDTSLGYREQRLLEELRNAKEELASLRRANSVINEPCQPPMTLPLQRRHLASEESHQQQGFISNRQQSHYLSQHSVHQGSSTYRPQSRLETQNSGFGTSSGLPKRALSTTNMVNSQGWSYRDGAASEMHSPLGYPTVRSYTTTTSNTNRQMKSPGYSARRERLRMESEQQEQLLRQQQMSRSRMQVGSSSDLHQQQMQRRQHYHSMSTIQPKRRAFEELETITLQPIGKGVQDLDSRMGSTTTLSQPARPTASSMMEGLNRVDNAYPSQRPRAVKNMTNFGKQASAVDISRQNHSGSTSFLAPRRVSGGALSDFGGFRGRDSGQTLRASSTVLQQKDAHQTVWAQKSPATPLTGSSTLMHVQETAPTWYRLKISRQEAIALLRNQPPGSFLVRDSTTYKDAYGLAVRVAKSQSHTNQKSGFAKFMRNILNDVDSDLVRHYLIETVTTPTRGVRIKGFSVEPIFPSLVHLIYEHTRTPLALPCCLVLPQQAGPVATGFAMPPPAVLGLGTCDSDSGTVVLAEGAIASGTNNNAMTTTTTTNNGHPKVLNNGSAGGRNPDLAPSPSQLTSSSAASAFGGGGDSGLGGNGGLHQTSPARNITSPLSPTAGLFDSELTSPGPSFFCRCLYLGFVDVESSVGETAVERAVDSLIPENILESVTCDQLGAESPVQYTECHLQVSPQEGILLTDLNRKIFFQRHLSRSSIVFVGVDPRDKMFLPPNHAVLGFQKPRLFGVVIKKLSGDHVCHVFSEFDSNHSAFNIVSRINSLLSDNK